MKTTRYLVCMFFGLVACGPTSPPLTPRAARDIECPDADVHLKHISGPYIVAFGCGKEMYYRNECSGAMGLNCDWVPVPESEVPLPGNR